ncbi:MAG: RSP_2648 family PIN domain-containing protein [Paracoccaceae bacterium]
MIAVIDACVLYPTVMREIVLGIAKAGLFEPVWSARILEEWARSVRKLGDGAEVVARGEIAVLRARWPEAEVEWEPTLEASLYLPDTDDRHVLAAAIISGAPVVITMNLKDFPARTLAEFGISAVHPDAYLRQLYNVSPDQIAEIVEAVRGEAERLSGEEKPVRALLKKARLPRLGKALG